MITFKIKDSFFDRQKVIRELAAGKRRALSRAGAFIRTRARSSIRTRRPGVYSKPGHPPFSHEGSLKRFLFFGYDRASDSVVVGPVGFRNSRVPALHEFGGVGRAVNKRVRKSALGRGAGGRFESRSEFVTINGPTKYEPRPYMGPALDRERQNIPRAFGGSVNKG